MNDTVPMWLTAIFITAAVFMWIGNRYGAAKHLCADCRIVPVAHCGDLCGPDETRARERTKTRAREAFTRYAALSDALERRHKPEPYDHEREGL